MERYADAAERKIKAIELMKKLDIYRPYIKGFEKNNMVCFYENFGGFWAYQEPQIQAKITELENEHEITIYAITHEYCEFGECYSFLYVNKYKEEWGFTLNSEGNIHNVFAYVWNRDYEWFSEFGTIGIQSLFGGIRRIA
jgi:CRISPR/Cas system-associated exonuclease Cas4 (RecB family)